MPRGASLLDGQFQGDSLVLWALVDPTAPEVTRDVLVAGTGHEVPSSLTYVTTIQQSIFVWHIFDCGEAADA